MTKEELSVRYWRVPRCGLELGLTSTQVYNRLQTGALTGLCHEGRWYVLIASALAFKRQHAERQAEAVTTR